MAERSILAASAPDVDQLSMEEATDARQARYRNLLRKLKAAMPVIERLNLYRPPVPLRA